MPVLIVNADQTYNASGEGFYLSNGSAYSGLYLRRDVLIASAYLDGMRVVETVANFKFSFVIDGIIQGGANGLNGDNGGGALNVAINSQASVSGFGEDAAGLLVNASTSTVTNAGEIWGAIDGVRFDHVGATTTRITNTGRIEGMEHGIVANGAGLVVLTNSGAIIGSSSGGASFIRSQEAGATGITHINNSGTMIGNIILNAGADIYDGRHGALLEGIIDGKSGDDIIYGGAEDNVIFGDEDNDHLEGGGGNDTLSGGSGANYLAGGAGDDRYVLGEDDIVDETLVGSDGADTVVSAFGSVDISDKTRFKGAIENIEAGGNFPLSATGNALDNKISTGSGADIIDGGAGIDIMSGGYGNDTFIVDNAGDKIVELANQGADIVKTSVSYTLGASAHVETLQTTQQSGAAAIDLTGNNIAQGIIGNNGANKLSGLGGEDLLFGLGGNDTLTGGAGKDSFYFNTPVGSASNVDTITDFNVADDTIKLAKLIFAALDVGALSPDAFWSSTAGVAHDASDRIVYDTDSGALTYDADGNLAGGVGAIKFAVVGLNLSLTSADFAVN